MSGTTKRQTSTSLSGAEDVMTARFEKIVAFVVSTDGVKGKAVGLSMGPSALSNKTYQFDKVFSHGCGPDHDL